jgi:hypothetical protein
MRLCFGNKLIINNVIVSFATFIRKNHSYADQCQAMAAAIKSTLKESRHRCVTGDAPVTDPEADEQQEAKAKGANSEGTFQEDGPAAVKKSTRAKKKNVRTTGPEWIN